MADDGIVFDSNPLPKGLDELQRKLDAAVNATFLFYEDKVQSYARQNAPWTDRTSNARNGLFCKHTYDTGKRVHRLTVFHSVPYGPWLEVAHSGKYQIIMPTVRTMAPQVMQTVRGIVGRLT